MSETQTNQIEINMTQDYNSGHDNVVLSERLELQDTEQTGRYILYYKSFDIAMVQCEPDSFCISAMPNQNLEVVRPVNLPKHHIYNIHTLKHKSDYSLQYRYFVLHIDAYYLLVKYACSGQSIVGNDTDSGMFRISGQGLSVALDVFDGLEFADSAILRQNIGSLKKRDFAVGVSIDYELHFNDNFSIAEICGYLPESNILVMIKDYETEAAQKGELIVESLVKRVNLCSSRLILEYSGFADIKQDEVDCILKHNTNKTDICGSSLVNILTETGQKYIKDDLARLKKQCVGVKFKMPWEYKQIEDVDKQLLKDENEFVALGTALDKYLTEYDKIATGESDFYTFVENIFTEKNINTDMVIDDELTGSGIRSVFNILTNGYLNITYKIENIPGKITLPVLAKKLAAVFLTGNFIISDSCLKKLTTNKALFDFFKKIISFRQNLDFFYQDMFFGEHNAVSPFELIQKNKKVLGIVENDALYICLPTQSLFRKAFYLPSGKWFDMESRFVVSGGYYLNTTKSPLKFFLKENNILLEKNSKPNMNGVCDLQITIFCTDRIHTSIYESDGVTHRFDVKFDEGQISVEYDTINLNRMITFVIVVDASESDKVYNMMKSINYNGDEVFFTQTGQVISFMTSHLAGHNVIKVI